jgi:hypothetical protein
MERVEGRDIGGPSQDGQGPRCGRYGKMTLLTVMTYSPSRRLRRFTSTLDKGSENCNASAAQRKGITLQFGRHRRQWLV